jgi:hypothetical protein
MYNLNLKLNRLLPMEEQCREITNREFAAASARHGAEDRGNYNCILRQ